MGAQPRSSASSPTVAQEPPAQKPGSVAPVTAHKPPQSGPSSPAAEGKSEVVLSGQLSRETAGPRDTVRFWITIENHSDKTVSQIWLEHLYAPGLTVVRRCWSEDRASDACYSAKEPQAPVIVSCAPGGAETANELCAELPPKHTLTVWGDLAYVNPVPRGTDFAVVRWTVDKFVSRSAIPLGPMESFGTARSRWELVTTQWQIGIPVWLAIFSAIYALWKNWREEKTSKLATESAQQRNTWNLLLLKVHRLAFEHYMPIVSTAQGILLYFKRLQETEGDPGDNTVGAFCYLLRFHWRVCEMKRSGASWYFKSLTAEEMVVTLFQEHRRSLGLSDLMRQAALDQFLDALKKNTTVADVLRYLQETRSDGQQRFWTHFQLWIAEVAARKDDALISALTKIITYETNRPYYYWYEELRGGILGRCRDRQEIGLIKNGRNWRRKRLWRGNNVRDLLSVESWTHWGGHRVLRENLNQHSITDPSLPCPAFGDTYCRPSPTKY
jgi:hypothetical protein